MEGVKSNSSVDLQPVEGQTPAECAAQAESYMYLGAALAAAGIALVFFATVVERGMPNEGIRGLNRLKPTLADTLERFTESIPTPLLKGLGYTVLGAGVASGIACYWTQREVKQLSMPQPDEDSTAYES